MNSDRSPFFFSFSFFFPFLFLSPTLALTHFPSPSKPRPLSHQALNRHPGAPHPTNVAFPSFRVGVSEDRNKKCRRTMEDSHSFVYDFGGVVGQGYFAVFE
jgi:hypothetical protein